MSGGSEEMEPGRRPARRTFRDRFFRRAPKNAAALSHGESAGAEEAWIPSSGPLVAPRREQWIPSSGPLVRHSATREDGVEEASVPRTDPLVAPRREDLVRHSAIRKDGPESAEEAWIPRSGPLVAPRREHWIPSSGPLVSHSAIREDGAEERARVRQQRRTKGKESRQTSRRPRSGKPSSSKDKNSGWNPLRENWQEVVTTVLSVDFDNLVDLEEFFGYYLLLSSDVYRELVEQFFKDFCNDFSLPLERLMVSRQPNYDQDSSDKEVEFLPPSPCSRGTLAWLQKMDQGLLERW